MPAYEAGDAGGYANKAVTVTLPGGLRTERVHAELTLVGVPRNSVPSPRVVIPITDPATQIQNLAGDWEQVTRPGRAPIAARAGDQLATVQLQITVTAPDGGPHDDGNTVEPILAQLANLAAQDSDQTPIALTWGTFMTSAWVTATGLWHIQDLEIDSQLMQPGTNNISRAAVTLTLLEHSPAPTSAKGSSAPGWQKPPAPPAPIYSGGTTRRITYWVVKLGDTAYKIARTVYGASEPGWRAICDANGILRPSTELSPGTTLIIPQTP